MRICFKYPTKSRPELFKDTLSRYLATLSGKHDCFFVISCDEQDESMNTGRMRAWIANQPNCHVYFNPPPQTKVTAVNANIDGQQFDLLIVLSDDMVPVVDCVDDRIADLFNQFWPEGDGVLHLNDGRVGKHLNTLPILDAKYYARDGYVYCPHYRSVWVDNEFQEVSERRGRAVYVPECLIRHEWIGEHAPDALHRHNESFNDVDARTFQARQRAGFP